MKFVVDAHRPRSLCRVLANRGHEAVHTLDLPAGNSTNSRIPIASPANLRMPLGDSWSAQSSQEEFDAKYATYVLLPG